jgi:hypothetical protein
MVLRIGVMEYLTEGNQVDKCTHYVVECVVETDPLD